MLSPLSRRASCRHSGHASQRKTAVEHKLKQKRSGLKRALTGSSVSPDGEAERAAWHEILSINFDNYRYHLATRSLALRPEQRLPATWTDLMCWAVLAGQPELAQVLWAKTRDPLRAAILAACVCKRLAAQDELRADKEELLQQSCDFERLATDLLDAIGESEDAAPLLSVLMCTGGAHGSGRRHKLWDESPLDLASSDDGDLSVPCMEVVSHRHAQVVLDNTFSGNFPGSRARIPQDASLAAILLQSLLFFLPGIVVEVMPGNRGEHATLENAKLLDPGSTAEWDPDLLSLVAASRASASEAGHGVEPGQLPPSGGDEESIDDVVADFRSMRWLHFYRVPKVKFALNTLSHVLYIVLLCAVLLFETRDYEGGSSLVVWGNWMRRIGELPPLIEWREVLLWLWTTARMMGEGSEVSSYDARGLRLYLRDPWNKLDVLTASLLFVTMGLRIACIAGDVEEDVEHLAPRARLGYALVTLLSFTRTLQYFRYFESTGVLLIILKFMASDVSSFFAFIIVFSFGFGAAFAVLMPGYARAPLYHVLDQSPLWQPFWGLFGDFDLAAMEEYSDFEHYEMSFALPVLLWVYMFLATVVLINLLIAQMSATYENVKAQGEEMWQFERAQLILEYKDGKPPLPPPFNCLWTFFHDVPLFFVNRCRRGPPPEPKVLPGFKLIPSVNRQGAIERFEAASLKRCLERRRTRREEELGAKVESNSAQLRELEASNNRRFEAIQGSLDKIKELVEAQNMEAALAPSLHTASGFSTGVPLNATSTPQKVVRAPNGFGGSYEQPSFAGRPALQHTPSYMLAAQLSDVRPGFQGCSAAALPELGGRRTSRPPLPPGTPQR